jgi:hypothetical protein
LTRQLTSILSFIDKLWKEKFNILWVVARNESHFESVALSAGGQIADVKIALLGDADERGGVMQGTSAICLRMALSLLAAVPASLNLGLVSKNNY